MLSMGHQTDSTEQSGRHFRVTSVARSQRVPHRPAVSHPNSGHTNIQDSCCTKASQPSRPNFALSKTAPSNRPTDAAASPAIADAPSDSLMPTIVRINTVVALRSVRTTASNDRVSVNLFARVHPTRPSPARRPPPAQIYDHGNSPL